MTDTNYDKTVLLVPGNGANAGITIADYSPYQVVPRLNGNIQTSTTQSKYYGSSLAFDGTGDYFYYDGQTAFEFGTGNFTIEMWVYLSTLPGAGIVDVYDSRPSGVNGFYPCIYVTSNTFRFWVNSADVITGATTLSATTWYHIAVSKSGTSTKMFLNGTQEGSTYTDSNNYVVGVARPVIGTNGATLSTGNWNGYMQDIRVTKGLARYTANFTPPARLTGTISGVVKDDTGANAIRTVWASPRLAPSGAKTTTSAADGTFSIRVADTQHVITGLDDAAGSQYNVISYDLITPV